MTDLEDRDGGCSVVSSMFAYSRPSSKKDGQHIDGHPAIKAESILTPTSNKDRQHIIHAHPAIKTESIFTVTQQ